MNKGIVIKALVLILLIGLLFMTKKSKNQVGLENGLGKLPMPSFKEREAKKPLEMSAWIPWWEEERGLVSMRNNSVELQVISPVWYQISDQGELQETESQYRGKIIELARSREIKIIPTISNAEDFGFDSERVSEFLDSRERQENFASEIIRIAVDSGFDGWDFDWEEIFPEDKDSYSAFLGYLARKFEEIGLLLSVSVHAQTGEESDWIGTKGQDLARIGQYADFVRIMAYDFHHAGSIPGSVTPLGKLAQVVEYSLSVIPVDKLVVGLPTYGYRWTMGGGQSMQYAEIKENIAALGAEVYLDEESFSKWSEYNLGGVDYIVWFEDGQTLAKKISLVREYGIYQICLWHLGGEDEQIWEALGG
jgi:spore germination protein